MTVDNTVLLQYLRNRLDSGSKHTHRVCSTKIFFSHRYIFCRKKKKKRTTKRKFIFCGEYYYRDTTETTAVVKREVMVNNTIANRIARKMMHPGRGR